MVTVNGPPCSMLSTSSLQNFQSTIAFAVKTSLSDVTPGYALFTGRRKLSNFSTFSGFLVWLKSTSCHGENKKVETSSCGSLTEMFL